MRDLKSALRIKKSADLPRAFIIFNRNLTNALARSADSKYALKENSRMHLVAYLDALDALALCLMARWNGDRKTKLIERYRRAIRQSKATLQAYDPPSYSLAIRNLRLVMGAAEKIYGKRRRHYDSNTKICLEHHGVASVAIVAIWKI